MSLHRILWLVRKEFTHIRRDPMMMRVIAVLPVIQLIIVGYAAQMDVEHIPTIICDEDRTFASRELARRIDGSRYFDVVAAPGDHRRIKPMLDAAKAKVAVIIPPGYQRALLKGRRAHVGVVLDGADATTSRIAASYLEGMLSEHATEMVRAGLASKGATIVVPPVVLNSSVWYNPDLRSRDYMVPGVVGLIVLILTLSLSTVAIVREREVGTLERLTMAPISPTELIMGKLLPYLIVALVVAGIALSVAYFLFHMPMRGSAAFFYGTVVLFAVNTLGLGLFMSSLARTQQQAILTNVFVIMPSILMSGFIAPIRNMPLVVQKVTYLIPLRYFLEIARGVCLKGYGPADVWVQLTILALLTVAGLAAGGMMLRRGL